MQLQLKHNPNGTAPVSAAFLRGPSPLSWMKEISRWNLAIETLECYLLRNNADGSNAGLFVIFSQTLHASQIELLEPFCTVARNLYIPVHAELFPAVSDTELRSILIWNKQVFHPAFGFTGLDQADRFNVDDLFSFPLPQKADWSFAHPGTNARIEFQSIRIESPSSKELMEEIKRTIGDKKLKDIKGEDKNQTPAQKVLNNIKYFTLRSIYNLLASSGSNAFPPGDDKVAYFSNSRNTGGNFSRFMGWLERNLEALESKREKEINRLLKMFDENMDEALKYAIPMDSPYLQRGKEKSSSILGRRSVNFNLGGLSGGQAIDAWNISDDHSFKLRQKYAKAAREAINKNDHRKAAYVYAHLLGDYYNAAQTLKQGGYYREAAALYLEHLNNKAVAAECYEQGGLYLEAIDLYLQMEKQEEAGDLYLKLDQKEKAMAAYRVCVDKKVSNLEMIDAARVLNEKMDEPAEAKEVLLEGWTRNYNIENCLKKYYDITLSREPEKLITELKQNHRTNTPGERSSSLLTVLDYVNKKRTDPELQELILEMTFEIVHYNAEKQDTKPMKRLYQFLPDDRLVHSDVLRYTTKMTSPPKGKLVSNIHLGKDTIWLTAAVKHHSFIATGLKGNTLCMIRGNWQGNLEYYVLSDKAYADQTIELVSDPFSDTPVFIVSSDDYLSFEERLLPKNRHFNYTTRVRSSSPHISSDPVCIFDDRLVTLTLFGGVYKLVFHDLQEKEIRSELLKTSPETPVNGGDCGLLIHRLDQFYFTSLSRIYISDHIGNCNTVELDQPIHYFALSEDHPSGVWIVVSTEAGCMLGKVEYGSISMTGQIFARDFNLQNINFLNHCHFALLSNTEARIYKIENDEAKQVKLVSAQSTVIAVLPTATFNECAVFEESGDVSFHKHGNP